MCDAHVWLCAHACQGTHGEVKGQLSGIRSPRSAPDSGAQTQVGGFIQQVLLADEPSCWTPLGWFILDACLLMSTQDFLQWCHMSPKKMSTARLYLTEWSDTLGSLKWIANLSLLNTKCAFYGKSKCFNGIITFIYLFYVCPWEHCVAVRGQPMGNSSFLPPCRGGKRIQGIRVIRNHLYYLAGLER